MGVFLKQKMLTNPVNYQLQFPNVPKRERSTGQAGENREKERGGDKLLSGTLRSPAPVLRRPTLVGREPKQRHTHCFPLLRTRGPGNTESLVNFPLKI